jgi:hypothetical protein
MEIIKANNKNLASVLMGKNIQFPWRSQRDVVISVPYSEWLKFIQNYGEYLVQRKPLDYAKAAMQGNSDMSIRYFLYDISWAQYSELACSSNVSQDSTLILPYFDDGKVVTISDLIKEVDSISDSDVTKYANRLSAVTRNYYDLVGSIDNSFGLVDASNLSTWNSFIFKVCIYLQSKSQNNIKTEKLNIDWRSL